MNTNFIENFLVIIVSIVIETKNLTKNFNGNNVVDHLSFRIIKGELLSLLGPNGAGKTTTIKLLTTILKPTEGTAFINRFDIQKDKDKIRKFISFTPQEIVFYEDLSAKENLIFFGRLYNNSKEKVKKQADYILKVLGLAERKDKAKNLSGGMKRRLNFGISIIANSQIMFLDEPTAGLDPQARFIVWDLIREIKKQGKTIILTTHNMHEAEVLSDRVLIIDNGKIIAEGSPDELKDKHSEHNILELKYRNDFNHFIVKSKLEELNFVKDIIINQDESIHIYFNGAIFNFIMILNQQIINDISDLEYMRLRQNTLEDVFLKITGRRLRE